MKTIQSIIHYKLWIDMIGNSQKIPDIYPPIQITNATKGIKKE